MWIPGHAMVGWVMARGAGLSRRDRAAVTWCAVLPDLDGLSYLGGVDAYLTGHHVYMHNLSAALLIVSIATIFARRRLPVFGLGFFAVLLHFLSDGYGLLEIRPLWPFSRWIFWPNGVRYGVAAVGEVIIPALLLWWSVIIYRRECVSILEAIHPGIDGWLARRMEQARKVELF